MIKKLGIWALFSLDLFEYELAEIFLLRFKELTYTVSDWRKEKINNFLKGLENN